MGIGGKVSKGSRSYYPRQNSDLLFFPFCYLLFFLPPPPPSPVLASQIYRIWKISYGWYILNLQVTHISKTSKESCLIVFLTGFLPELGIMQDKVKLTVDPNSILRIPQTVNKWRLKIPNSKPCSIILPFRPILWGLQCFCNHMPGECWQGLDCHWRRIHTHTQR